MKTRLLIVIGVLVAFFAGTIFGEQARESLANAFATNQSPQAFERQATYAPRHVAYAQPATYRPVRSAPQVRRRSTRDQVFIVAGSSAAGAGIGALAGGKKGAGIGAIVGAVGGLIYNEKTKNKRVDYYEE
ncbi:MAG TPA: hypothetical protein VGQ11_06585 [Candidatus Acidoferrales bacterium]|jgi:outer membrane lipoprotein SlyB|nr:hypothetical protein [Candidatus Acidoferrales bacterium]